MTRQLDVEILTPEAFAAFGDVIQAGIGQPLLINEGTALRYDRLAAVELATPDDQAVISIFRGEPRKQPIKIHMMEKHPLGSQAFMPLAASPYYIVVAPAGETVDLTKVRCFVAQPGQGVNVRKGVWHHPLLTLEKTCDFLVIDRDGQGSNLVEQTFNDGEILLLPVFGKTLLS